MRQVARTKTEPGVRSKTGTLFDETVTGADKNGIIVGAGCGEKDNQGTVTRSTKKCVQGNLLY